MPGTVRVRNLRNIASLDFNLPDRGVWLLTAGNGAGKTSLLACLRRIGHRNSFPVHFPSSLRSPRLDNHAVGTIEYEINGESVEYAYRGERWTPRPRRNVDLFERFGYSSVIYIGATADRITPRPEDFDTRHVRAANRFIIEHANTIFETTKFTMLRSVNVQRGIGNEAFVLALGPQPHSYHSEKHFSLGELCVLKLLRTLADVNNNSLIIIDELEMALHPRAQVKLLDVLKQQARQKSLTIIFSTHSVTLLKSIDRRNIIYLDKQVDGRIIPVVGCFPTYAIGHIASEEELLPDIVVYVEDLMARDLLGGFFEMFANERFVNPTLRPTLKVIPVGGFNEVVSFVDRSRALLPPRVHQKALLDADVADENVVKWREQANHLQLAKFQRVSDRLGYLPFTPKVGIMNYAASNIHAFETSMRTRCADNQLAVQPIVRGYDVHLQGTALRNAAKNSIQDLCELLEVQTQCSKDAARERICGVFVNGSWAEHRADFMRIFGQMVANR